MNDSGSARDLGPLVENIDGIVWELEIASFRFTYVSQAAERILGYPVAAWLEGDNFWRDHLHPDDRSTALAYCVGQTEAGLDHDFEYRMLHADGRVVWLRDLVHVVFENGRPVRLQGVMVDISRQKELDEKLRQSEANFRLLYENSPLPYQSLDAEGRFLDINPAWLDLFGYPRDQVIGRPFPDFVAEASRPVVAANFPVLKQQGLVRDLSLEMLRAGGQTLQILLNGRSSYDLHGEFERTHCVLEDVTERQRQQRQAMRTGQLAAIGELAAGVAHEINNPINGVINYAQLIANQSAEAPVVRDLALRIIHEGDRIAGIVRHLLNLARDDGEQFQPVDLTRTLAETLALVGTQFHQEGISLELTLTEGLPKIAGQVQLLQQLFINILSNARYALNQRPARAGQAKTIQVTLDQDLAQAPAGLAIRFRDNGVGIPADLLPRVLQPFVTSKPSAEGTGLGLSISHEIVKRHSGEIYLESIEGEYTEVTILLPLSAKED